MKVLIIEDESLAADKLIRQLKQLVREVEILGVLDSIEASIDWLSNDQADLIFCDIHLSDGLSFNIFNQVEVKTPIIFITAYDQYAIQAFKVNSIDYLLKPVAKTDLATAINKYKELKSSLNNDIDFDALMNIVKGKKQNYQARFMVYFGDKIRTIEIDQVAYFYAEGKYVFLVCTDDHEYIIDYTLDKLTGVVDPDYFFRINRQFIVCLKGIDVMHTYTKGRVKIELKPKSKKEAIVSVDRAANFKNWLNR